MCVLLLKSFHRAGNKPADANQIWQKSFSPPSMDFLRRKWVRERDERQRLPFALALWAVYGTLARWF